MHVPVARVVTARLDSQALRHNLAYIRSLAPASNVMAVIKANAYGHGMLEVAQVIDAEALAVARMDEAVTLREAGELRPVLVLEGCQRAAEMTLAARHELQVMVHTPEQANWFGAEVPVEAWLKVETGMHRLGLTVEHFRSLALDPPAGMQIVGLVSHLAFANEADDPRTEGQLRAFTDACEGLDLPRSVANSGAILSAPDARLEWVRPGIVLYGVSPFREALQELRPVMTLAAPVIAVKQVAAGETVGYGGRYRARRDVWVATIAAGYGDGYPATAGNGTPVLIGGKRYGLAGAVSMDMCCCELGVDPAVKVGDEAVLWGPGLPLEEVAEMNGLNPYVLPAQLTRRVRYETL